jgi:hypothetical protein
MQMDVSHNLISLVDATYDIINHGRAQEAERSERKTLIFKNYDST